MADILEQFEKHGMSASFHFADDSGKEWGLGWKEKEMALKLFDNNKGLQKEMRRIATKFLWSLKSDRPEAEGE